ncbi:MAG: zf-TFIIB domain-containing protein [Candidatus Aminicenantes bacterium]
MSNCRNCGAPLPANSLVCPYCKTRHDVDLKGIHRHTVETPESDRICPRCNQPMPTIDLKIGGKFLIERCPQCLGLFFDPGELEALLDQSVSHVYDVDYSRLQELSRLKRHQDYPVTYIKCPVCQKLMNRINFGAQSGVIIDKCRHHGVWVDGGELRQLMEWTKAGGQIHHERKQLEMGKIKLQQEKDNLRFQQTGAGSGSFGSGLSGSHNRLATAEDWGILSSVSRLVGKLF